MHLNTFSSGLLIAKITVILPVLLLKRYYFGTTNTVGTLSPTEGSDEPLFSGLAGSSGGGKDGLPQPIDTVL